MYQINGDLLLNITDGVIFHGCNAQGVMGSGFAKSLREKYPEAYDVYRAHYLEHGLSVGDIVPISLKVQSSGPLLRDLIIINAITQEFYRGHPLAQPGQTVFVDYDAILTCLEKSENYIVDTHKRTDIHMPKVGAGLAGGDWTKICAKIEEFEKSSPNNAKTCVWVLD